MANLTDLSNKRVELITAIDNYQTAIFNGNAANILAAKNAAIIIGRDYSNLAAQVKKDNPLLNDELFSNPALMIQSIRDDVATIMTTGQGIKSGLKILIDTEGDGTYPGSLSIDLNFPTGSYMIVNWGDGSESEVVTGNIIHSYSTPGLYDIVITGTRVGMSRLVQSTHKLLEVKQWGQDFFNENYGQFFYGASKMQITAIDAPIFAPNTDCRQMFQYCANFNSNIDHWDMSNVVSLHQMFLGCTAFNQPLNSWDISGVTNISRMFFECTVFNQPLNNWNLIEVNIVDYIFHECNNFNQDISMWDVSGVLSYTKPFINCPIIDIYKPTGW